MNYFAHALLHLDRPYFLAGVALPDWCNVIDRKLRVRSHHVAPFTESEDPELADFAKGVMRHHADDEWFHRQPAFVNTSMKFSVALREVLRESQSHRTGFLGHILVELLLDGELISRNPGALDRYYESMQKCLPERVEGFVCRVSPRPTDRLQPLIPRFIAERFLYDYADDAKLWFRLNQVMRRVGLNPLPETLLDWLPQARSVVRQNVGELFPPP